MQCCYKRILLVTHQYVHEHTQTHTYTPSHTHTQTNAETSSVHLFSNSSSTRGSVFPLSALWYRHRHTHKHTHTHTHTRPTQESEHTSTHHRPGPSALTNSIMNTATGSETPSSNNSCCKDEYLSTVRMKHMFLYSLRQCQGMGEGLSINTAVSTLWPSSCFMRLSLTLTLTLAGSRLEIAVLRRGAYT